MSPELVICVVFVGKTLHSHSASLRPVLSINGYQQTVREPDEILGYCLQCSELASHPGGVAILLVASCYRNQDKLWQYMRAKLVRLVLL